MYSALVKFSRGLALAGGIFLPVAETIRRSHQLGDVTIWPAWLDDWFIGLFLLYGWWRTRRDIEAGRPALAAAWGFACAMGYMSFFGQLMQLDRADPSGFPSTGIVAFKAIMLIAAIAALLLTLRPKRL
jgi:hypothetical protein